MAINDEFNRVVRRTLNEVGQIRCSDEEYIQGLLLIIKSLTEEIDLMKRAMDILK